MTIPYIRLNERFEITEGEQITKSLSKARSGKDFLAYLLGDSLTEKLEELCLHDKPFEPMIIKLPVKRGSFRYASVVRCSEGGVVVYLPDKADAAFLSKNSIAEDTSDLEDFAKRISIGTNLMDAQAFVRTLSRTVSALVSSQILAGCSVRENYCTNTGTEGSAILAGAPELLLVIASLICAISGVGTADVDLSVTCRGPVLEISITAKCEMIPPFIGSCADITSISPYLPSGIRHLRRAALVCDRLSMNSSAEFAPDGRLTFTVGNLSAMTPAVEFKFPSDSSYTDGIVKRVLSVISCTDKQ